MRGIPCWGHGPTTAILVGVALGGCPGLLPAQADTVRQQRDTARLDPIVTVLRVSVEQSRAPFATTVVERDQMQRAKPGMALDEALAGVAGVQVDNRFNYALGERISIRGFGARPQFGVRGIRVILDGIPLTLADGQTTLNNVDVSTLARAEVIRGPASAQYGNASGGVIQLETDFAEARPGNNHGGEVRASVGADGLVRQQFRGGAALEREALSISASRLTFDGYRDWNDATNQYASFRLMRFQSGGSLSLVGNWVHYDSHNPGALPRDSAALKPGMAWPANKNTFRTGEDGEQAQIGFSGSHVFTHVELQAAGHVLTRQIDNPIPQRIVAIDRNANGARVAAVFRPARGVRELQVLAGGEVQHQNDQRRNFTNTAGARGAVVLDQRERVSNQGVFGQLSTRVVPGFFLMAGIRHDRIRFRVTDRLVSGADPDDSGDRTMRATSPSAGVTWSVSSAVDVYANISTSFETPTTSELANQPSGAGGFNFAVNPQRTRSVEGGVKGRFSVSGVAGRYELAAYDARVRDALIPFEVPSAPGRQFFRNAGSTRHRGAEASTAIAFPRSLALRAAYTYIDARFDRYVVTQGGVATVYDGNQLPGVAPARVDVVASYEPERFFVELETRTSSSVVVNDANSERAAGFVVHGLRSGLRPVRILGIDVAPHLGVWNLTDRRYVTSVVVNAFGGRYYEPGPPRSVYGGVSASF